MSGGSSPSGGGAIGATLAQLGIPDPDARLNHIFFEDFSWAVENTTIEASTLLLDKFVYTSGSGTLMGNDPAGAVDTTNSVFLDVDGASAFKFQPRWNVPLQEVSQVNIELKIKLLDTTGNRFFFGFYPSGNISDAFANSYGVGVGASAVGNIRMRCYNGKIGADVAWTAIFNTWKFELNMIAGVPTSAKLYKDGVLADTLAAVDDVFTGVQTNALVPALGITGAGVGDDVYIDYIKCWAVE